MSKESSAEIATLASKVMKNRSFSKTSRRLAASVLAQREDERTEIVLHYADGRKVCREIKRGRVFELSGEEVGVEIS